MNERHDLPQAQETLRLLQELRSRLPKPGQAPPPIPAAASVAPTSAAVSDPSRAAAAAMLRTAGPSASAASATLQAVGRVALAAPPSPRPVAPEVRSPEAAVVVPAVASVSPVTAVPVAPVAAPVSPVVAAPVAPATMVETAAAPAPARAPMVETAAAPAPARAPMVGSPASPAPAPALRGLRPSVVPVAATGEAGPPVVRTASGPRAPELVLTEPRPEAVARAMASGSWPEPASMVRPDGSVMGLRERMQTVNWDRRAPEERQVETEWFPTLRDRMLAVNWDRRASEELRRTTGLPASANPPASVSGFFSEVDW